MQTAKDELKLKTPLEAIHSFAKTLTSKAEELAALEHEHKIGKRESTAILTQMVESHLYAVFKTMIYSNRVKIEDKEAAFNAMTQLLEFESGHLKKEMQP